jgi:predicted dithiol-disulfide oxidoreductase (DUF899 family)
MTAYMRNELGAPKIVDRNTFHAELDALRAYWTTSRGVEEMDNSYRLLDLTVYGRQETWEDSPTGWPQGDIMDTLRTNGRPTSQWSRMKAGHSDDLGTPRR